MIVTVNLGLYLVRFLSLSPSPVLLLCRCRPADT